MKVNPTESLVGAVAAVKLRQLFQAAAEVCENFVKLIADFWHNLGNFLTETQSLDSEHNNLMLTLLFIFID